MAALARLAVSASLSLVAVSSLWGCSSSTNNGPDAAATSTKMDSALGTSSDLPVATAYDSSPVLDGHVNIDGPSAVDSSSIVADAFLPIDIAGNDIGTTPVDLSSGPDKPASSDLPSDKSVDVASPADGPVVISLDAPTSSDLGSGGVDTASGPDIATCGEVGQACCSGNTCDLDLLCLNGASCSCVKALVGRYLLRADGKLLYEADPSSSTQTVVLDASTVAALADVSSVSEGPTHGCAVQSTSKTAYCWRVTAAGNTDGQLGNGTTDTSGPLFRATPVLTAANQTLQAVVGIATEEVPNNSPSASCAITSAGNVYCWGNLTWLVNNGKTLTSPYAVPITLDGTTQLAGVEQVAVHGIYACAIVQGASSKELWCWGDNRGGQLGTGDTTARQYPTKVVSLSGPSKILTTDDAVDGEGSTCVLDGTNVRCWGNSVAGEVGTGLSGNSADIVLSPTLVTMNGGSALGNIVDLHGGDVSFNANFCGLTSGNTLQCWGSGLQANPASLGVTNVVYLGGTGTYIRFVTSDGIYHSVRTNGTDATRSPNCGAL